MEVQGDRRKKPADIRIATPVGLLVESSWRESFESEWLAPVPEFAETIGREAPDAEGLMPTM